eukprot:2114521-Pleurochrysis_carterae.AAC.1
MTWSDFRARIDQMAERRVSRNANHTFKGRAPYALVALYSDLSLSSLCEETAASQLARSSEDARRMQGRANAHARKC